MWFLTLITFYVALISAVAAAPTEPEPLPDHYLQEAEASRWHYCVNCLLWCRCPELAERQATLTVRMFPKVTNAYSSLRMGTFNRSNSVRDPIQQIAQTYAACRSKAS